MKKLLSIVLVLVMILSLSACGNKTQGNSSGTNTPASTPAADTSSATNTPAAEEPKPELLSGTVVIYSTQTDTDHEVFLDISTSTIPK